MNAPTWKAYWPDEGETVDDAMTIGPDKNCYSFDDAADFAAQYYWDHRDGWQVGYGVEVDVVIVSASDEEVRFACEAEASVYHNTWRRGE